MWEGHDFSRAIKAASAAEVCYLICAAFQRKIEAISEFRPFVQASKPQRLNAAVPVAT
jgi:hypothetical protein